MTCWRRCGRAHSAMDEAISTAPAGRAIAYVPKVEAMTAKSAVAPDGWIRTNIVERPPHDRP